MTKSELKFEMELPQIPPRLPKSANYLRYYESSSPHYRSIVHAFVYTARRPLDLACFLVGQLDKCAETLT